MVLKKLRILSFILLGMVVSGARIVQDPPLLVRAEKKKKVRLQTTVLPAVAPASLAFEPTKNIEAVEYRSLGHRFADSTTLSMTESKPDPNGVFSRVKVIRTSTAYRMVRIEEKVKRNFSTGEEQIMKYVAMMAQEVMVQLQPGYSSHDLALLAEKYGYTVLRNIPYSNVYLVSFDGTAPETLPQVQANLAQSKIVEIAGPDYISFLKIQKHFFNTCRARALEWVKRQQCEPI